MPEASDIICILDDDAFVLSSIRRLLDSDGYSSHLFEKAEELLEHAARQSVSLAVLDLWLTGTTGLEVQQRLREVSPQTRVIVMSGREQPGVRAAALAAGALAFLLKPFDDTAFLDLIHQALEPQEPVGPKVP